MKTQDKSIFQIPVKLFQGVFAGSFLLILLSGIFNTSVYNHVTALVILALAATLVGVYFFSRMAGRYENFFRKYYFLFLAGSAVLLFTLQLLAADILRYNPTYDVEAVFHGAIRWVQTGTFETYGSPTCHPQYFYLFPNNLGALSFLALVFKIASLLGIREFFTVAMVVNGLMVTATMVFASLICKRLYGVKGAMTALLLFLISPPFYLMAGAFYTDCLSMLFPVLSFYLFLVGRDKRTVPGILIFAASVLALSIGVLIKPTVLILAVATLIWLFVCKRWKQLLSYAGVLVLVLALVIGGFQHFIYTDQLDKEQADTMRIPVTYWLNLAFRGEGRFNEHYFNLAQIANPIHRDEVLISELESCLKEKTPVDFLELFEAKSTILYGDGTYSMHTVLGDPYNPTTMLRKITRPGGKYYSIYSSLSTGIFAGILLFMVFSVKCRRTRAETILPQIAVFGLMLFLLMWEVDGRYIVNFIPLMFIAAVAGVEAGAGVIPGKRRRGHES